MMDYSFWKLNAFGYHITNILFHILTAILVYYLLNLISKKRGISLVSALLFVAHPVFTSAVTYISGRGEILAAFFMLLSFVLYIKATNLKHIYLSLVSFIIAILCKEIATLLLLLFVLYEVTLQADNGQLLQRLKKKCLPFFTITGIYLLLRMFLLRFMDTSLSDPGTSMLTKSAIAVKALGIYIRLLFLPLGLHMERVVSPQVDLYSIITLILLLSALVWSYKKSRLVYFGFAWFILTLIPVSGILSFGTRANMAEHWLYIPSIGFFLAITTILSNSLEKYKFNKLIALLGVGLILTFYCTLTIRRNAEWRDPVTFYETNLKYTPNNHILHNNLGSQYKRIGDFKNATASYKKAIQINPNFGKAYDNLGNLYFEIGKIDKAIEFHKKALELEPNNPKARNNLACTYGKKGLYNLAIQEHKKALELHPFYAQAYNNLGITYKKKGNLDKAINEFKKALEIDPGYADAYYNLGSAYYLIGLPQKAKTAFKKTLEINPNFKPAKEVLLELEKIGK